MTERDLSKFSEISVDERIARAAEAQSTSTIESHRAHFLHCQSMAEQSAKLATDIERQSVALEAIAACAEKLSFLADMLIDGMKDGRIKL